ncbi:cysteine hydrolase family protein [Mycolicibacterium novocastrense]|uniref:Isochorismatase hydrolase n=1 Tax=Mycolicibacterium novocastrense TaxID=59813 RepID=A0ABQ0KTQ5_MYCNV|nr:isochorismatase family cysteine hydrolase [Mycolicibacterium novocastrense]GAT12943.1 isochorismatase hydrolase [Mycolicibacterium novocastrense]
MTYSVDYLRPDWDRSALVLIDVQNDFVEGAGAVEGTAELVPVMARVAQAFRERNRPVVHAVRCYEPGSSDVDLIRRASIEAGQRLVAPGTVGADIVAGLLGRPVPLDWPALRASQAQQIGPREYVIFKPRWSVFHRTVAEDVLRQYDVNTVVVAGCNLPDCPRATLFDASERDYRTALVADATSQVTDDRLADLGLIGVQIVTSDRLFVAIT